MSMITTIQPSGLSGMILASASKSSMQRACAAALLRVGETGIMRPGHSNDDKAALGVIRDLGAEVVLMDDGSIRVRSKGVVSGAAAWRAAGGVGLEVNCGESGLGLRMFAPIIGLSGETIRVKGEGSLLNRPMDFFDEVFPRLGIRVVSNKGRLPLEIQGPLRPRDIEIDGSLSSQFLTGLLFAYSAARAKEVTIRVRQLKSKPYIDLTLQVMKHFGWHVENRDYEEFYFDGAVRDLGSVEYTVEGDWSGGAFLLVAGAVAGPIVVKGLDRSSTQADKAILQALSDCGASLEMGEEEIRIGPGRLHAFRFNATDCPDLFPPLVALAAYCEGTSVISGVSRLAHKESNRGLTLQEEFGKMGINIDLVGDRMLVRGSVVRGARVHSRHDHRIAMACAVAALRADGEMTIEDAQAIDKSYPDFYRDLQRLDGKIQTFGV
ncbi:MAG TPA: 3-phosphoshikimate 1-carboxyvinyltransferase [Puia sp.]|jgi:3-phosphoshikimate 1-carboxyvinyltransferase|nr:3-phosphoshikimate 1-carboxyvinyltransferase [Puia sp.]